MMAENLEVDLCYSLIWVKLSLLAYINSTFEKWDFFKEAM